MGEITKREFPEEVLFRLREDGTYAAHQRRMTHFYENGVKTGEALGQVAPLAQADVSRVLGEITVAMVTDRDAHASACADLRTQLEEAQRVIEGKTAVAEEAINRAVDAERALEAAHADFSAKVEEANARAESAETDAKTARREVAEALFKSERDTQ